MGRPKNDFRGLTSDIISKLYEIRKKYFGVMRAIGVPIAVYNDFFEQTVLKYRENFEGEELLAAVEEAFKRVFKSTIENKPDRYQAMMTALTGLNKGKNQIKFINNFDFYFRPLYTKEEFESIILDLFESDSALHHAVKSLSEWNARSIQNNTFERTAGPLVKQYVDKYLSSKAYQDDMRDSDKPTEYTTNIINQTNELYQNRKSFAVLSASRERELLIEAQHGDTSAKNLVIQSNFRYVEKAVTSYSGLGLDEMFMYQTGTIGLNNAVRDFDPYKGIAFAVFVEWKTKSEIKKHFLRKYKGTKLPERISKLKNMMLECAMKAKVQRSLTIEELAEMLHISVDVVALLLEQADKKSLVCNFPTEPEYGAIFPEQRTFEKVATNCNTENSLTERLFNSISGVDSVLFRAFIDKIGFEDCILKSFDEIRKKYGLNYSNEEMKEKFNAILSTISSNNTAKRIYNEMVIRRDRIYKGLRDELSPSINQHIGGVISSPQAPLTQIDKEIITLVSGMAGNIEPIDRIAIYTQRPRDFILQRLDEILKHYSISRTGAVFDENANSETRKQIIETYGLKDSLAIMASLGIGTNKASTSSIAIELGTTTESAREHIKDLLTNFKGGVTGSKPIFSSSQEELSFLAKRRKERIGEQNI